MDRSTTREVGTSCTDNTHKLTGHLSIVTRRGTTLLGADNPSPSHPNLEDGSNRVVSLP
ncbi:hypothetical protein TanjilG_14808 [Lupinus angustifolius]|uniref:Uncharacterized protein n=1 Tax=Lupinus angustifolius TaxID=3871 RepID=A0A1J7GJL0_LUPAN|nr:hypothetical protein TanjilG_14808 [Lupinus angustifolius]